MRDLIKYLELAFDNLDEKGKTQCKLHKLCQIDWLFLKYLAHFCYIADWTEYDEKAKHTALLSGLGNEIQTALIIVDLSYFWEETVATLQKIDNKICALSVNIP